MNSAQTYFVDEVIDTQPFGRFQKTTIALCCVVAILDGLDAQLIGFLAPSIAASLDVDIRSFGPMFSASLVGLMIGTLVMGTLGDRWGRKRILVASTLMFGVMSGCTGLAQSLNQLAILRFLTGIGLGGALPNIVALATEYTPVRLNRIPACMISAAMPTGGLLAGLIGSAFLADWGWRGMFFVGAILPIAFAVVLLPFLPESVRFLSLSATNGGKVRAIMLRIWPQAPRSDAVFVARHYASANRTPVSDLFRESRAAVTLALWLAYFMNLLVLYFVVSWMPALLKAAGMNAPAGIMAITAFSLGGVVGSLSQGPLMSKFPPTIVFLVEFAVFILLSVALTVFPLTYELVAGIVFLIGCTIQGAQAGLNAFSATFYPTAMRSTGIAWGLGIGRIGSIIGPLLGGVALSAGWSAQQIFLAGAVPAICAAVAVSFCGSVAANRSRPGATELGLQQQG